MTLFYKNYNTKLPNRTLLKRTIIIICLFFTFSIRAQANYTGDKPLIIHTHDTITGDLVYTLGSSYYSNLIESEKTYEVTHNISIPQETYLNLKVPVDYQSTGDKEGTLIFWAQQQ